MSEKKIPAAAEALAEEYAELAILNFAMDFYNTYEQFYDCELAYAENGREIMDAVLKAAEALYQEDEGSESTVALLDRIRREVVGRMDVLTAYIDWFNIHEYLLNRAELKFEDDLPEIDNDEEARRLLQFVFESEDNMEVNLRIKEMISQLPVRMTSKRFFELIRESLSVYKGAERESLKGFVYMILSAAGIYKPENKEYFKEFEQFKEPFLKVNYKEIDKETFDGLEERLASVSEALNVSTEFCIAMQTLINSLYTYHLVKKYVPQELSLKERLEGVINEVTDAFKHEAGQQGDFIRVDTEGADRVFASLEGKPEKLVARVAASEGRLESVKDELDKLNPEIYRDLTLAGKLMSTSDFAEIEDSTDRTECSADIIEETGIQLVENLQKEFEGKDRQVKRAMMASVLKELPVFFVSHTEVMNYVRFTLDHCGDKAEKTASLRMFWKEFD